MQQARRRLLIASGALLAPASSLFAQSGHKVARIGYFGSGLASMGRGNLQAFREGMRELGYVEGRDVVIEARWAEGDIAKLPGLAKELTQMEVDIIVAGGTFAVQAAKAATSVIPIVAAGVADLAESGLVASLAKPGGNLTGAAVAFPETAAKQMEIMREVLPRARRVAVLWPGPSSPFFRRQREELEARAPSGIEFTWHAPRVRSELAPTLRVIRDWRPDFLVVVTDPFYYAYRKELAALAAQARIPAAYGFREYVDAGGLLSYGASLTDSFRRAASYVDKILKGAKPADLPVQMPSKLELAVNANAAKALGLRIPQSVLSRADIVVP